MKYFKFDYTFIKPLILIIIVHEIYFKATILRNK